MDMEKYWLQQRVFFFAQVALFPKILIGQVVDEDGLQRLFPYGYKNYLVAESAHTTGGHVKVKIVDIDAVRRAKFIIELKEYLQKYQNGDLTTGTKVMPIDFIYQQKRLITFTRNSVKTNRLHKTINLTDLWTDQEERDQHVTTFWELLLTEHFLEDNIQLLNIGYEGVYTDDTGKQIPLPFAEFKILPQNTLFFGATVPPVTIPQGKPHKDDLPQKVSIIFGSDNIIYAKPDNGMPYRISRELRTDMGPYKFINHVFSHPRTRLNKANIKIATGSSDITELVNACGFNKSLKATFFPKTTEQVVFFEPKVELTEELKKMLENHKWD